MAEKAQIENLLTPYIRERGDAWQILVRAFEKLNFHNVEKPIEDLELLRFLNEGTDKHILIETCRLLGFDLTRDVLELRASTFTSIVNQLPLYNDYNGRDEFVKFISLIIGSETSVVNLWTQDYKIFLPSPQGLLLIDGGSWYRTTHIDLIVKRDNLLHIFLQQGKTLLDRIKDIFYKQAPITLVIHRIVLYTDLNINIEQKIRFGDIFRYYRVGEFPLCLETSIDKSIVLARTTRKHTI